MCSGWLWQPETAPSLVACMYVCIYFLYIDACMHTKAQKSKLQSQTLVGFGDLDRDP